MKLTSVIAAAAILASACGHSSAATVLNSDGETVSILVTEGGKRREVMVAPGQLEEFCLEGCFVTYPDGDMSALLGTEEIEVLTGGRAKILKE